MAKRHIGTTGDDRTDEAIAMLVESVDCDNPNHLKEMMTTAVRVATGPVHKADFMMMNRAMKELEDTCEMFAPYKGKRKVTIFGSARTPKDHPAYFATEVLSKALVAKDWMTITGGGPGIMEAGNNGSGKENTFGLGITLPFEQTHSQLAGDPKFYECNYFFTRKVSIMREAHASVAMPGGFGTWDEIFEVLTLVQTGKCALHPVVMLDKPGGSYWRSVDAILRKEVHGNGNISGEDFNLYKVTDNVVEAVEEITNFYKNFHSYRFVQDNLIMRLNKKLTKEEVSNLNIEFADAICNGHPITQRKAFFEEDNRPDLADKPRLVLKFNRHNYGQLRVLINRINSL
tara:strand:- start:780 stop:1811 length:1032 start_codon:yes stop_codon:yes gene_type:complete